MMYKIYSKSVKVYDNALLSSIFADVCFWGNCKKEYKSKTCDIVGRGMAEAQANF